MLTLDMTMILNAGLLILILIEGKTRHQKWLNINYVPAFWGHI